MIKSGYFAYEYLLAKATEELANMDVSYTASGLPDEPHVEQIEQWAIEIRKAWYLE